MALVALEAVVVGDPSARDGGRAGLRLGACSVGRPLALQGARFMGLGVPDEVLVEHHEAKS